MIFVISTLLSVTLFILSTKDAKAIIVMVPVILIPIVNTVVWIIGAMASPILAMSVMYFKLKKKHFIKGILLGVCLLIVLGIITVVALKLISPARPIY